MWYAQFKGTIWTLDMEDLDAIVRGSFDTPKTKEIYASILHVVDKKLKPHHKGTLK